VTSGDTLFGYAVRSDFDHARLGESPPLRGEMEIRRCPPVELDGARVTHHLPGSETALTIARGDAGALLLSCSVAGGFRIEPAALRIGSDARHGGEEIWEHRVVTLVVPLLLSELGDIALHAAAVERDGRAVAFTGTSTRGKSTLALAASSLGLGVLADDGAVIEPGEGGYRVWPGPAGIRVARAGDARKGTVDAPRAPAGPVELAALVALGPREAYGPIVEPVEPVAAVPSLVPSLIFSGSDRLPRAMRDAARLASGVPVFRCAMPEGVERLPGALAAVLDLVMGASGA
jgi:hypothetical protein